MATASCVALLAFGVAASDAETMSTPNELHAASATRLSHARVLPYPLDIVWPTCVRYLRVDRGYTVVDRDPEAGFVLFDFPVGERSGRGSVELFTTKDDAGRDAVRLNVSTDAGPTHLPHAIADGLAHKLRAERGPPPPAPPPPPKTPPDKAPDDGEPAPLPDEPPLVLSPNAPGS